MATATKNAIGTVYLIVRDKDEDKVSSTFIIDNEENVWLEDGSLALTVEEAHEPADTVGSTIQLTLSPEIVSAIVAGVGDDYLSTPRDARNNFSKFPPKRPFSL